MATISVQVKGKPRITLDDKDYLSGGEGKVYVKGNTAYKIYHELDKVVPEGKVQELKPIVGKNVLGPNEMLYNPKTSKPIGFTMDFISGTIALTQLFTTAFRNRNGVTPDMSVKLVNKMIETIQNIHDKDILMIDGNEFNYLVDEKTLIEPYFIDVDSYQTKSYPARVLMPSVKDWHTQGFSKLSDWFSFGVVATQIFVGIHPYKGTHPNYGKYDMESRMKNNASIFGKGVSLPGAARSFDLIPDDIRNWLIDIMEKGKRILPPMVVVGKINKPQLTIVYGGHKNFIIDEIFDTKDTIYGCEYINNDLVIYNSNTISISKRPKVNSSSRSVGVVQPLIYKDPVLVDIINGSLSIKNSRTDYELCKNNIVAQKKMIIDGRIYIVNDDKISEIKLVPLGIHLVAGFGNSWNILPKATKVFRGVFYSDVIGTPYLYIPYDSGKMGIFKIDELKGFKIQDAKYENGVCILMASKKDGLFYRITIKFNFETESYIVDIDNNVTQSSINFVTLDNGVVVLLTGDDTVEVFHKSFSAQKKIIDSVGINTSAILFKHLNKVFFWDNEKIYSFQMKK